MHSSEVCSGSNLWSPCWLKYMIMISLRHKEEVPNVKIFWTEIQLFAQIVRLILSFVKVEVFEPVLSDFLTLCVFIYWVHIVSGNIDHFKQSILETLLHPHVISSRSFVKKKKCNFWFLPPKDIQHCWMHPSLAQNVLFVRYTEIPLITNTEILKRAFNIFFWRQKPNRIYYYGMQTCLISHQKQCNNCELLQLRAVYCVGC